ncbi:MAG: FkbM family methyltransferase [Sphingomonadaceae bacterium]|nr:FkbM family methyltransferase [Sphingomonadaceae bacterium]
MTQLAHGEPFFVDTRDTGITPWIILGGTWETFVDPILCGVTRLGDRVLDAGANQGYYAVKLGRIVGPGGHLATFEPNPAMADVLRANLAINALEGHSMVYQQALGAEAGLATLRFDPAFAGSASLSDAMARGEERIKVEVVRGDDVLSADTAFDVMKFDIEGFEPQAALGLAAVLGRSAGAAIVIEITPKEWRNCGNFAEILERFTWGHRVGFEICHDGLLERLDLTDTGALAGRAEAFYALLLPQDHWAMDFARSKLRG